MTQTLVYHPNSLQADSLPYNDKSYISIEGEVDLHVLLCDYLHIFPSASIFLPPISRLKGMFLRHSAGVSRFFVFSQWHSFRSSFITAHREVITTELLVPQGIWASFMYLCNLTMHSEHLIKVHGVPYLESLLQKHGLP